MEGGLGRRFLKEVYDKIVRLKLLAEDAKMPETHVYDNETILCIIQSIPSPNNLTEELWVRKWEHSKY